MAKSGQERRQYLRIETPLSLRVIGKDSVVSQTTTEDISPAGIRFKSKEGSANINDPVEITLEIPGALSPVHVKGKIIWKRKVSGEGAASTDFGCEFTRIEEDNKNTFLKYFCDLLYERGKEVGQKGER